MSDYTSSLLNTSAVAPAASSLLSSPFAADFGPALDITPTQSATTGSPAPSLSFGSTRSPTPVSSIDACSPREGVPSTRSVRYNVHNDQTSLGAAYDCDWHAKDNFIELLDVPVTNCLPPMPFDAEVRHTTYTHVPLRAPQPEYAAGYHANAFAALSEPNAPPLYATSERFEGFDRVANSVTEPVYMARPVSQQVYAPVVQQQQQQYTYTDQALAAVPTRMAQSAMSVMSQPAVVRPIQAVPAFSTLETPQGTFYFVPHKSAASAAQAFSDMAVARGLSATDPSLPPLPDLGPEPVPAPVPSETVRSAPAICIAEQTHERNDMSALIKRKTEPVSKPVKKIGASSGKKPRKPRSTVKRFMCPQEGCGRAFARNFNMQSHLKSHLDIREFDCPLCPKKFSRRHDRGRHCATVHDYHVDDYQRAYHDNAEFQIG
ncbi:hypothetical protein OIV83_005662 [Microbotryomycetes sp. JL201]|nr:hypothetical protein OIV83_005662 [Microbotryomycetes sp. JL201]